ncbi:MAG: peptidase dimerization domain-containing protein [Paludibacteraceae bacterium]
MASADEIYVTIKGTGGHGALPHLCNDTVLAASQTIVALQQVKSRLCKPIIPMVLTFGKMLANGSTNVIPDTVQLAGTFRTVDESWRAEAERAYSTHNHTNLCSLWLYCRNRTPRRISLRSK